MDAAGEYRVLITNLRVSGLLSFGPDGIDLPLRNLNVLIGPNGSGKSNLLEVLSLLRAAPTNLPEPVKEMGGVREWLWKGANAPPEAAVSATFQYPAGGQSLCHTLRIADHAGRFEVVDESIANERPSPGQHKPYLYYDFQRGQPVLNELRSRESLPNGHDAEPQETVSSGRASDAGRKRRLRRESVRPEESILSQVRDPERYPELTWLQEQYEQIRLYRHWTFGPNAPLRQEQSTHASADLLSDGGENLALIVNNIRSRTKSAFLEALRDLYDGIEDFSTRISGGNVLLFLVEQGGREIPATRLSDGTLRYLCLLAILLHPEPPPLVAIEEPELGLHPDVLPIVARLLQDASHRTQLVITTHSSLLIDALSDDPKSVVVCEKEDGRSHFRRLDTEHLRLWLQRYTLGELWSKGEIGGTRW